jgi:hypothetical protein
MIDFITHMDRDYFLFKKIFILPHIPDPQHESGNPLQEAG